MIDVQAWWNGIGVFLGMAASVGVLGYGTHEAGKALKVSERLRVAVTVIVVILVVVVLIGAVAGAFPRWK